MNHQQDGFPNYTNRMPALLAINHAILADYKIRVSENPRCRLKVQARMLRLVCPALFRVPFKEHRVIHNV